MVSGWSPSGSGIVGDSWYDKSTKTTVIAGASPRHKLTGTAVLGGSPEQMLVRTVGDALKERHPQSVVLTASLKQYSAVLNGGHHPNGAYWFDVATGRMVTSDYYVSTYPAWTTRFNAEDLTAPFFRKSWMNHVLGTGSVPDVASRNAFRNTPYANEIITEFAKAMVERGGIGTDADPDLIAVSFSATDTVGHQYGTDSPEYEATLEALDHQLGDLLRTLDKKLGKDGYTLALTADHGSAPTPEKEITLGHKAGRLNSQTFIGNLEATVSRQLNVSKPLILSFQNSELYLDYASVTGVSQEVLDRTVTRAVEAQPGIARAYSKADIAAAGRSNDRLLKAVAEGYYPGRSGDIYVLVKPGYMFAAVGTTHGTPYDYDAHVPLILFGAGVRPGKYEQHIRINDMAPTIGYFLGIDFKGDSKSRVLKEALR
jgi:predicted AlkP superfamily pyrophosphatase or phosphodiesterase